MISYGSLCTITTLSRLFRSHQLGEGHSINTEMPYVRHPSQPVYGSQPSRTEMSNLCRSHQLGKGQPRITGMSVVVHPSQPVYGSRNHNAAMPMEKRSHLFTRGQPPVAEMLFENRLSREGSINHHRNVIRRTPFPTSFGLTYAHRNVRK